jgi:hypothetical protein
VLYLQFISMSVHSFSLVIRSRSEMLSAITLLKRGALAKELKENVNLFFLRIAFVRANMKLVESNCHRDLLCCDGSLFVFSHQSYEVKHAHYERNSLRWESSGMWCCITGRVFHHVLKYHNALIFRGKQSKKNYIVCFLLGNSPASEFYIPTFWNTLSVPFSYVGRYE